MRRRIKIAWLNGPEKKDYQAAEAYLALLLAPEIASQLVRRLRKASISQHPARDILRAAGVSLLGVSDSDEERKKILSGEKVAPLLLVRNPQVGKVVVADGYHRLCTIYGIDQEASIPCKIV